jgi:hypothetical protein
MTDPFLKKVGVSNADEAMRNSLLAALRRNKTYTGSASTSSRREFRQAWATLIKSAARAYRRPVEDADHCATIARIAQILSRRFSPLLIGSRLRFGTSQKALNLYLKFLWRLGSIPRPPHCPVDRTVLLEVGVTAAWTNCDSKSEYMNWIRTLRRCAGKTALADWEYERWN